MKKRVLGVIPNGFGRWIACTALLCIVAACASSDDTTPRFEVFPTSIVFDSENPDANVVYVESNGAWRVTAGTPAPVFSPEEGFGNAAIRLLDAPSGRSTFVVTMGTVECTVIVTRLDGEPEPDPKPEPNPDADVLFEKSWAEVPAKLDREGDYHYVYHMRPDAGSIRNFSVCYSEQMMCPVWIAAPMHSSYKGSSGRTDAYAQDPKLNFLQPGKWTGYTRGHMLGSGDRTISRATNEQVFYYSNIAPQLQSGFNTGGGAWNNLEGFTDGQWCADTLYQVVGCHWADRDKLVDRTTIPTHYYKVLLRTVSGNSGKWVGDCTASELKCAAFIVEHKSQPGLRPGVSMMMPVAELEKITGFIFFPNVPNAPKNEARASDWGL